MPDLPYVGDCAQKAIWVPGWTLKRQRATALPWVTANFLRVVTNPQ